MAIHLSDIRLEMRMFLIEDHNLLIWISTFNMPVNVLHFG